MRIGKKTMTSIRFSRKNGKSIKTSISKNQDTLIAPEDDRMLNDVYLPDQLLDFRLRTRLLLPRRGSVSQPPADSNSEEHEMDTDQPPALVGDVQSLSKQ